MKTTLKTLIWTALCCAAWSAFAAAPPPTTTAIAFKAAAGCAGPSVGSVSLSGDSNPDVYVQSTTTSGGDPVTCGKAHLRIATDGMGNPVSSSYDYNMTGEPCWINISGGGVDLDSNGQVCFPVDLEGLSSIAGITNCDGSSGLSNVACPSGDIGFQVQFISSGMGCSFGGGFSPAADLGIDCDECGTNTEFTIGVSDADGAGHPCPGSFHCWNYTFTVQNCTATDLHNVKIQGGTAAWLDRDQTTLANDGGFTQSVSNKKKNQVWTLTGADINMGQTVHVTVHVCGTVGNDCGQVMWLSGPWSATGTDDDGNVVSTTHTPRVSVAVDCDTETCEP
jgi:hypothetical protein